jgi:hypothetical protein
MNMCFPEINKYTWTRSVKCWEEESSSCHKLRPINGLFQPQCCNCLVVSLMVVQSVIFWQVCTQEVTLGVFYPTIHPVLFIYPVLISFWLGPCGVLPKYLHGLINSILLCSSWISYLLSSVFLYLFVTGELHWLIKSWKGGCIQKII